ncbi:hypothetical protein TNCV_792691 [Trichonephila clavipes]|nr:hypothetical protein TNCV_792691 [Trichonephila clavipes]
MACSNLLLEEHDLRSILTKIDETFERTKALCGILDEIYTVIESHNNFWVKMMYRYAQLSYSRRRQRLQKYLVACKYTHLRKNLEMDRMKRRLYCQDIQTVISNVFNRLNLGDYEVKKDLSCIIGMFLKFMRSLRYTLDLRTPHKNYTPVELAFSSIEPDGCAKDKAPVLFLHGVTSSKEYWYDIPQTVANATKRKVYALDARNHGDSEWSDVFDFDCNVDDLLHFMDRIGARKVILVGHSMGGITAIKTALRAPERVERLVVEDIAGNKEALSQERMNSIVYFLSLAIKAIQQVPPNEEEEKAKHFILDFLFKNLPEEFVSILNLIKNSKLELYREICY